MYREDVRPRLERIVAAVGVAVVAAASIAVPLLLSFHSAAA